MFSTSGYFRGVTCPYFVSGLCERPYCHFRHVKPTVRDNSVQKSSSTNDGTGLSEDGASSEASGAGRAGPSSLLSMVGQAIKQVERDIERDRASLSSIKPPAKAPSSGAAIGAGGYVYKPTPIQSTSSASASGSGATAPKKSVLEYDPGRSSSAKYKPTPIRLLKQSQPPKSNSEKNRYVIDDSKCVNDNEYDPAVNFSTTGKGQKRYAPKLSDEGTSKKTKLNIDDNDDEPTAMEGVFSDDDGDDMTSDEKAESQKPLLGESANEAAKIAADSEAKKTEGVFEMDITAILGTSSNSSGSVKSHKSDSKKQKTVSSKHGQKASSHKNENSKNEREKSSRSKSSSDSKTREKEKTKHHSKHANKVGTHKKNESEESDRNIFSILKPEQGNNDTNLINVKKEKNEDKTSNDENRCENKYSHSGSSSSKSDKHRSSHLEGSLSKHEKSNNSSSRHRSSSGSSSSSAKHKHSSSHHHHHQKPSSTSHKEKSSSSKHHSSSSAKDKSRSSSRGRDTDQHRSKSHSSTSSRKDKKSDSADAPRKPKPVPISNADLFGEDSDESDDVMIVEPPKVDIAIVELSSEESDNDSPISHPSKVTEKEENKSRLLPSTSESEEDSEGDNEEPFTSTLNDLSEDQLESLERSLESEDTYDECLRIFNEESSRTPRSMVQPRAKIQEKQPEEEPTIIIGKKRVARVSEKDVVHSRQPKPKANARPSPAQVMHQRFIAMQKAAEEAAKRIEDGESTSAGYGKGRVAHSVKAASSTVKTPTPVGSVAKTITSDPHKRVSHIQKQTAVVRRPSIPADFGSKVPTNVRQRYLNLIIDECLKIYPKEEDAFKRALTEEKAVYSRSTSKNIYLNVAVNCVKRLRAEILKDSPVKKTPAAKSGMKQFSHAALLDGKIAAKTSYTVKRSGTTNKQPITFSEADIYQRLSQYILTDEQRRDNGFPFMSDDRSGQAVIKFDNVNKKVVKTGETNERLCVRCGRRFLVNAEGAYLIEEKCVYHWGKLWKRKIGNSIESRYTCCSEDASATGCSIGKAHVHEQNKYACMKGYMKTMPKSPPPDGNYGVYALDCEMVYTTTGLELARITVIDSKLELVYEQLVKPSSELLDPNTRFSGLTEEDFIGVTSTIRDVQAVLLSLFSDCTILVGHSLESDLVALKLVHDTVVDTSVVYPHRLGPPYKRALRNLMADHLKKIIQDDVGGHDSQEDAQAAMELMLFKIKEDAKKENRRQ